MDDSIPSGEALFEMAAIVMFVIGVCALVTAALFVLFVKPRKQSYPRTLSKGDHDV